MIKYHNAKDIDGKIISIKEANTGETYYCIGCGREMIAKKGKKKEHHFSHKQTLECNAETYLHKYAKSYIKKLFDSQEHLYIVYQGISECCKKDTCKFNGYKHEYNYDTHDCEREKILKFDLKEYYDTCELEVEYNGFIADVLLSSRKNPNRPPCFIEVAVTHFCEEDKKNSGIKIIEITLPKGTDNLNDLTLLSETDDYEYERKKKQTNLNRVL